jgi:5-methylcytosine-specific restriction endonuclease McrA
VDALRRAGVKEGGIVRHRRISRARPTSRGGSLGRDNLRVCCMRCNEIKGRLDDEEFCSLVALIAAWPTEARTDVLMRLRAGGRPRR